MNLEKTVRNLESRGFRVSHFASPEEAAAYIAASVSGKTVDDAVKYCIDDLMRLSLGDLRFGGYDFYEFQFSH